MATVDDEEGYQADNVRHLVLDPPAPPSVLLVTGLHAPPGDALYVDRALRVDDGRSFAVSSVTADRLAGLKADDLRRYGAVIVLASRGLDAPGRRALADYVRGGGGLFIDAGPDTETADIRELVGTAAVPAVRAPAGPLTLVMADARHPILRAVSPLAANAAEVRVNQVLTVADEASRHVLLRFSDGTPALVESRPGSGRVLLFASDLGNRWNDLPLQPMFLPLLHEVGRYLTAGSEPVQRCTIGQLPPGIPARPGVVTVAGGARQPSYRVAVNVDAAESDPSRLSIQEFAARMDAGSGGPRGLATDTAARLEDLQRWWRYGLLLVMLALIAESLVARRTL